MNQEPQTTTADDTLRWITILLPTVLAIAISFFSPNYRIVSVQNSEAEGAIDVREGPFGGDFLQEYVGGWILHSEDWSRLYEFDVNSDEPEFKFAKQQQHDAERLGFSWPKDQYFPMVYPPFYYWATGWLSQLGDQVGYPWVARIWLWLNGLAVTASVWLLNRFFPSSRSLISIGVWSLIFYTPLLHNFNLGQKGGLLLLIVTATYLLLRHRKPFAGGMVFGLIAFKPHLGLTIGLAMLLKRQWSFCAGALTMVGLLTGSSMLAFPGLWSGYIEVVRSMQDYVRTAGYELFESHSLWGASELLLGGLSPLLANSVAIVLSLAVAGLLVRAIQGHVDLESVGFQRHFAAMLLATVMLSPHFYSYDLTITLLAILLITFALPRFPVFADSPGAVYSWRSTWNGKCLVYLLVALFLVGALSSKLAMLTRIQFSIPIMIGILWLLGCREQESSADQAPQEAGASS